MKLMNRIVLSSLTLAMSFSLLGSFEANATPAFAKKENKKCGYCHLDLKGGGKRGFRGKFYDKHEFSFKTYVEKVEAAKAGVKVGALGPDSKPTKPYTGK